MARKGLEGKVIWISGASSGIGRALALGASALGARIVLSGRRIEALDDVAQDCKARGAQAAAVLAFDLEKPEARAEACEAAPKLLGPVDVMVFNAGMSQRGSFLETSRETFDRVMNLDFHAQVDLLRRSLPAMVARGSGTLVAVSSYAGLLGVPVRTAYSSAKHALAGLFQSLRAELIDTGVRVVTVYPGYVRTAVGRNALMADGSPAGREDPHIEGGAEPSLVARRILRAMEGGSPEVRVAYGLEQLLGLALARVAPLAYARLSARHVGLAATPRPRP